MWIRSPVLSSFSESCAVDSDCLGETEVSDSAHGSAGSSPAELLLRLLHVATRGQTEYWCCICGGSSAPPSPTPGPRGERRPPLFLYKPWDPNPKPIKCWAKHCSHLTPTAVLILCLCGRPLVIDREPSSTSLLIGFFYPDSGVGQSYENRLVFVSRHRNVHINAHTVNKVVFYKSAFSTSQLQFNTL